MIGQATLPDVVEGRMDGYETLGSASVDAGVGEGWIGTLLILAEADLTFNYQTFSIVFYSPLRKE
ncbi:hypothetical protein PM082_009612 [Marasmius tenuissimus]|nr:hypothetical protein PM082_009612 [Marasmius tenuissimus]